MPETFLPLEAAANYEGISYKGITSRLQRNPFAYKTKLEPRDNGKARVLIAVSSLSEEARRRYKAEQKKSRLKGDDLIMEKLDGQKRPWYLEVDYHWYIATYPQQHDQGKALADIIREWQNYTGSDRTEYGKTYAAKNNLTTRTLYRLSENYLEASMWALHQERLTGENHDFLKVLALCRKPKQVNTFPSLDDELKATIENIWFDRSFRANRGTVEMLYTKLCERAADTGEVLPSYQTVARYIRHLMESYGGASAAYLAERGTIAWKNRYMMKGMRDTKGLKVMEIVVGDVHTFDFFCQVVLPNGRLAAIRPKLIAWMDIRSRDFWAYSVCIEVSSQEIKSCYAKGVLNTGSPRHVLIDNGKDFSSKEMLGYDRSDRLRMLDAEAIGFYKALGAEDVFRSLPYQPWDKPVERVFRTVCEQFSKQFTSYVGTLTGSRTDGKVKKDIKGLLSSGKLFTMQEIYDLFDNWVNTVYRVKQHRGLKDCGETYTTPGELFAKGERHHKAAPPDSYIAMLMMKAKEAAVKPVGIRFQNRLYNSVSLQPYYNSHVLIRYLPANDSAIYAFTMEGELIGEIPLAERLAAGFYADEAQLEEHKKAQARHLRKNRELLEQYRTPFEERQPEATPRLVGGADLTLERKPTDNVISLPNDKQYRQEQGQKSRKKKVDYLDQLGQDVFDKLKQLG